MPRSMFFLIFENHQVFWGVVSFIPVDVVDYLSLFQWAPQHLFCHNPVFVPTKELSVGFTFAGIQKCLPDFTSGIWCHSCRVHFFIHVKHVALPATERLAEPFARIPIHLLAATFAKFVIFLFFHFPKTSSTKAFACSTPQTTLTSAPTAFSRLI